MNYRAVFLDADDTLFDFGKSSKFALASVCSELGLHYSPDLQENYEKINTQIWSQFEKGLISKDNLRAERFRRFFDSYSLKADSAKASELYIAALSRTAFFIPGAEEFLKKLDGIPLVIVTNGIADVQKKRFALSGLDSLAAGIVISEEAGYAKPHPGIFEKALNYTNGIRKSEIIMTGDSLSSDILGANNAGIGSCWYNPDGLPNTSQAQPDFVIKELAELLAIIGL